MLHCASFARSSCQHGWVAKHRHSSPRVLSSPPSTSDFPNCAHRCTDAYGPSVSTIWPASTSSMSISSSSPCAFHLIDPSSPSILCERNWLASSHTRFGLHFRGSLSARPSGFHLHMQWIPHQCPTVKNFSSEIPRRVSHIQPRRLRRLAGPHRPGCSRWNTLSPPYSPLSFLWRHSFINLHKMVMTRRSLLGYSHFCTYGVSRSFNFVARSAWLSKDLYK